MGPEKKEGAGTLNGLETSSPLRGFLGVLLLNALLAFPILYQSYKHYDPELTPWDVNAYMTLVEHPGEFEPPFRFRFLAPLAVRAMRILPGYDVAVDFTEDPRVKKDYFHFSLFNFAVTVLTSGLLFVHLRARLRPAYAYLGSVLYLFSFYSVVTNIIPMGDTVCQLAIIACILLYERDKPVWFALACLIGVFAKETLIIVLGIWILIQSLTDRRRLWYLLYALPAALAYFAATRLSPSETEFNYYRPGFVLDRVFRVFMPSTWDASLFFHVFVAQAPLLLALTAYAWLKGFHKREGLSMNPELLIFPLLIWLGITLDLGNSTGRVAFMGFPALIYFEAMVVQAWVSGTRAGHR
ncbi:MAG: hypothetical protein ABIW76_03365 [Fibrobacteria bacterium]